jgi:hypothetical protein
VNLVGERQIETAPIEPILFPREIHTCKFCQRFEASEGDYCEVCAEFQSANTGSMWVVVWLVAGACAVFVLSVAAFFFRR